MSTNKSITRSVGIIGSLTLLSRILGFIRDVVIAQFFGTGMAAQAFVVAFRIPNLIRSLVGEGATNAAFVPTFSEYLVHKKKKEFWDVVRNILSVFLLALILITALGIVFAPGIVKVIAFGFMKDVQKLGLTITLTRLLFPYILLIGLTAYGMGVLHAFKSFALSAFSPSLLNISIILSAIFLSRFFDQPVFALVVGVLIGGLLQLALHILGIYAKGFSLRGRVFHFKDAALIKSARLLGPRVFGAVIYQLNVFVDTICASLSFIVGEGAIAALYYANRILLFPLGIFGIAISTASLPFMSHQAVTKDIEKLKSTTSFSLRSNFLLMLPASMGLFVLSEPIIRVLFERGNFNSYSSAITSWALLFYSIGLTAYGGVKIISACFYSLQDTRTPVKVTGICLVLNLILNILLMWHLKVGGLALASSIAVIVNFLTLIYILEKRIGRLDYGKIGSSLIRIFAATTVMGWALTYLWQNLFLGYNEILRLIIVIVLGVMIYILSCILFRVEELRGFIRWGSQRK